MLSRRYFSAMAALACLTSPGVLNARSKARVLVVGAGAAGLTAAYHLANAGADVRILEASSRWGGRLKRVDGFSDVPLDLGAEWLHDDPTMLGQIIGRGDTDLDVETIDYRPQTYRFWHEGELHSLNALRHAYGEVKFYDTTWYGFFERFILPTVRNLIEFNAPVSKIASIGDGVSAHLESGAILDADKILITVPLSVLQQDRIVFSADLAEPRLRQLKDIRFGQGFKIFMKFTERFYPDILMFGSRWKVLQDSWDEKIYYDAALGKPTSDNILGLFTVSEASLPRALIGDRALLQSVMAELTEIFGDVVNRTFVKAEVQNWSRDPHILGSYSMSNNSEMDIGDILAPLSGRVYFAGEALGGDAQSTVHGAAFSAIDAVESLIGD